VTKATNLSSTVKIYLKNESYLAIKYAIGVNSSVLFCLAPQVETAQDCPFTKLEMLQLSRKAPATSSGSNLKVSKLRRPVRRRKKRAVIKAQTEQETLTEAQNAKPIAPNESVLSVARSAE